jgi:hypothetical protein
MSSIRKVSDKLLALKAADPHRKAFGANAHGYALSQRATAEEVQAFEAKHGIMLPEDFHAFLTEIGNGGAGPFYGLFPLGMFDGSGAGLEPWEKDDGTVGNLSEPFPHRQAWNLPEERFEHSDFDSDEEEQTWVAELDRETWNPALMNGAFPICHHGCAYRTYLVVTGPERGNLWFDGRASDQGIVPHSGPGGGRVTFAEWYDAWLDGRLDKVGNVAAAPVSKRP